MHRTVFILAFLCACTTVTPLGGGEEEIGSTSAGSSTSGILDPTTGAAEEGSTGVASTSSDDGSSVDGGFLDPSGTGNSCALLPPGSYGLSVECSLYAQDCCPAHACKPWANDGGGAWNATRCSPIDPDARQPGEACEVVGSPVSGVDSCDEGATCWGADSKTLEGECVALCAGSDDAPECPEGRECLQDESGVLSVCVPPCDPLGESCPDDQVCHVGTHSGFGCIPAAVASCPTGSVEIEEDLCASYCDLTDRAPCEDGLGCVPYFVDAPEGHADVGVCVEEPR